MRMLACSPTTAGRLPAVVVALALQSCAVVSAGSTPARSQAEASDPLATPSTTSRGTAAQAPRAALAPSPPAPEADDPEVAARIDEDSNAIQEVDDAEVSAEAIEEPPTAATATIPALPELEGDLTTLQAEYDIPIVLNEAVVRCIRLFRSPEVRPHFVRWLSRSQRYAPRFREILRQEGLPEDTVFVAMVESGFGTRATSRAAAVGPWQFMGATARRYGLRRDRWVDERRDPEKSTRAAARLLKALFRDTGDWHLAWAAYNAGPRRVSRATRQGHAGFWEMARHEALPGETRAYVPRIIAAAIITKHAAAFGFGDDEIEPLRWMDYEEVTVPRTTPLELLAEGAGVSVDVLLDLNPELRRTRTPPRRYALKIPRDRVTLFAERWPRLRSRAASLTARAAPPGRGTQAVRVRPGDSLWTLARRHRVAVDDLAAWNAIPKDHRHSLRAGRVLLVRHRVGADAASSGGRPTREVRVKPGDSLWTLARRFGVTVQQLAAWNGIRDEHRHELRAGSVLRIR